jgi:hypothetical protein
MKKRSERFAEKTHRKGKGGRFAKGVQRKRKSARKAPGAGCICSPPQENLVRTKGESAPFTPSLSGEPFTLNRIHGEASVPSFVPMIEAIMIERQKLIFALRGALYFYDRVIGNVETHDGWTAKDIRYLDEIRALAWGRKMEIL